MPFEPTPLEQISPVALRKFWEGRPTSYRDVPPVIYYLKLKPFIWAEFLFVADDDDSKVTVNHLVWRVELAEQYGEFHGFRIGMDLAKTGKLQYASDASGETEVCLPLPTYRFISTD